MYPPRTYLIRKKIHFVLAISRSFSNQLQQCVLNLVNQLDVCTHIYSLSPSSYLLKRFEI